MRANGSLPVWQRDDQRGPMALHRAVAASVQGLLALIVGDRGIDHDPRGWGFEVMGPAGGNGLGQCLRYVDFCVANSTGSTMDGSSFSGLLTPPRLTSRDV
jgi:hypothetical protein